MPLREYSQKRSFDNTPEPDAHVSTAKGNQWQFVVQEHHASQLHYDFRLEMGGVLKSWAVPRGPSLDPAVKRLAVEVEDHPIEYAGFEGTIPEGNYGAGQVFRWDSGSYTLRESDAEAAWNAGALHFTLHGQRLNGDWRLFRLKRGSKPQWLLQKVQDSFAEVGHEAEVIGPGKAPRSAARKSPSAGSRKKKATAIKREPSLSPDGALSVEEFLNLRPLKGDVTLAVDDEHVRLTHLERVYWPGEGITKGELLQYCLRMAPTMMPRLSGRPAILKRFPRGVAEPGFHQHDLVTAPEFLQVLPREEESGKVARYAVFSTAASLLYLVNLGAIEQHPFHSRVERLNHPDWAVIDLDPHGAAWKEIAQVALEVRSQLAAMQLPALLKTSGSRGLHIYTPLQRTATYEDAARIAEGVCQGVHDRLPRLTTLERRLESRGSGEVYLDWMQNALGKSAAGAYSVRARPGAPVSCPITWDELEAGATIQDFTLRTVPDRIDTIGDPWADALEGAPASPLTTLKARHPKE